MSRALSLGPQGARDRTFIPKGTPVHSTYPGWPSEGTPAGRRIDLSRINFVRWEPDRIVWAGGSGYWRWVYRKDLT